MEYQNIKKTLGTTQKNFLKMHCVKRWMQTRLKLKQPIELEQNKKEREDIYIYEDFSKATVAIRKENWEKVKAVR